ncbi:hypothetical protein E3P77_00298 [Wallemia ichthyophaga]|nr:hypothetical protein E3P77_00298 [Wallemia ichthyophaga]
MSESININIPERGRQRSSSESEAGSSNSYSASNSNSHSTSVKAALPTRSPFSAQPFRESATHQTSPTSPTSTPPQALAIPPPRRLSGSFEFSGQPSPAASTGNTNAAGISNMFRRFSFKGTNQPVANNTLNTIPAKQPLQTEITPTRPQSHNRRKSEQKRPVSPMDNDDINDNNNVLHFSKYPLRGHLSRKIPNVKLKPRPAVSLKDSQAVVDDDLRDEDDAQHTYPTPASEKPLTNFVFCSTGILNRSELQKKVIEMGASFESSFTDNVTHLIAIDFGSPKYNCAVRLGAVVITPAFIDQCYLEWLDGENVDTRSLAQKHALKPFANLTVSMSGIGAGPTRQQFERSLISNGANVSRDLHKQCTHLVTENTTSAKVKWAKNYNAANANTHNIHIVWTEWISACQNINGRLPESDFSVDGQRPNADAFRLSQIPQPLLPHDTHVAKKRSFVEQPGNEDLERAVVKKSRVAKESLVEGILSQATRENEVDKSVNDAPPPVKGAHEIQRVPTAQSASFLTNSRSFNAPQSSSTHTHSHQPASSAEQKKVFTNYTFSHRGFEKSKSHRLDLELEKYGASVTNSVNLADLTIVPFNSGTTFTAQMSSLAVTECWVERCMYEGVIVPYNRNPLYRPIDMPVIAPSSICLTFSGLDECERTHVVRLFKSLGIHTRTSYPREVTHLVSVIPPRGKRYDRAVEWRNPVIDVRWVWEMASSGHMPPLADFTWGKGERSVAGENKKAEETNFLASDDEDSDAKMNVGGNVGSNDSANVSNFSGPPPKQMEMEMEMEDKQQQQQSQPKPHHSQHSPSSHTNIPLRKTHSTNPFKIRDSGAGLHDSILQLLKQEGEKIYPALGKTKKRPRLKRTSTGDSRGGSETPAPVEQQTDEAGSSNSSRRGGDMGDHQNSTVVAKPKPKSTTLTSSPLSSPSPPPSLSQPPTQSQSQSNGVVNESLRIMYDDPKARNERKRILQALTNTNSSDPRSSNSNGKSNSNGISSGGNGNGVEGINSQSNSQSHPNVITGVSRSDENEGDVMYRFAREDFEKPIAETRPRRGAAKEGIDKINQQYDPTQLDEF